MDESIFKCIFRYRATENMSPKESYLTEILSWMINNLEHFGEDYISFLYKNANCEGVNFNTNDIESKTQIRVNKGIIDMVLLTPKLGFICEHKVDSQLRDNQINDYKDCAKEINNNVQFKTVLLIKYKWQQTQQSDIAITWKDIYDFFSGRIKGYNDTSEEIIINQFLLYLKENNMGAIDKLQVDAIKNYCLVPITHNNDIGIICSPSEMKEHSYV